MSNPRKKFSTIILGLAIILLAVDILLVSQGFPPIYALTISLIVIGALLYANSVFQTYREERQYYGTWGLFLIIIAISITASMFFNNWVMGLVVFIAGIGGIVLFNALIGGREK